MRTSVNDMFTPLRSIVRFNATSNIRFVAEELRRYGIKTNQKNDKGKVVFFQSAHIICSFTGKSETPDVLEPIYALVSFKDLFKSIGKNDAGADDQDIVRVWEIAHKLEKRSMLEIQGTAAELLDKDEEPEIPDVYANICHIHRNDEAKDNIVYRAKFATNKSYKTTTGQTLTGISDFFILS